MKDSLLLRITVLLVFIFLIVIGLIYAQPFLVPVFFAGLLSLLLLPISKKIQKFIHNEVFSIILSLILFFIVICGVSYFISTQISNIISDSDLIESKIKTKAHTLQATVNQYTGMDEKEQEAWFDKESEQLLKSGFQKGATLLVGVGNFVFGLTLVMIYTFFLQLYRGKIKLFILSLIDESEHEKAQTVIHKVQSLVMHYITGLCIALSIIGVMNAIGLSILGIEHGIFLGLLAGFLNIIPYIGSFIGAGLPIIMALIYKDSLWYPVGVLAIFMINQFIDNNITTPNVVGGYVRLNSLATIFIVIIGGLIWGVAGMILFIPLLGIFKILCDHIEPLKPLSILLSDDESKEENFFTKFFKKLKTKITS
ncbi:AI-2E family transporter [Cytophaga aurantiaca]|uniref:AI-2E family transporter n=1 Tax=Cytophaga aurantiaca TaxID=29530 RepID=UPI000362CEE0|nr:AI-2E family transporter [Cytophaga aurantiaca]